MISQTDKQSFEMKARCTACSRVYVMTPAQMQEAHDFGVPMSPCCMSVATVESVKARVGVKS